MTSVRTIPLLFLNLGGEMLYILDQRLCAQRIPKDKAFKVMNDIVGIMLNEKFLRELFKPQQVYNKVALRQLFEDLAHASIMRLNGESMNKLYDLMTMVFKYQLVMCPQPQDVILITLNHLDAIRDFVSLPMLHKQIDSAYNLLMKTYSAMSSGELQAIRQSLLNFLQDIHVRVSIFLRENIQTSEGRFVIPLNRDIPSDGEVPGIIRYFDPAGDISHTDYFHPGGICTKTRGRGSTEMYGDRGTTLGGNIYKMTTNMSVNMYDQTFSSIGGPEGMADPALEEEDKVDEFRVGKEELNLLMMQLLGTAKHSEDTEKKQEVIYLNLFQTEVEEEELYHPNPSDDLTIDVRYQGCSDVLQKVFGEMTVTSASSTSDRENRTEEESLLDLLDDV